MHIFVGFLNSRRVLGPRSTRGVGALDEYIAAAGFFRTVGQMSKICRTQALDKPLFTVATIVCLES